MDELFDRFERIIDASVAWLKSVGGRTANLTVPHGHIVVPAAGVILSITLAFLGWKILGSMPVTGALVGLLTWIWVPILAIIAIEARNPFAKDDKVRRIQFGAVGVLVLMPGAIMAIAVTNLNGSTGSDWGLAIPLSGIILAICLRTLQSALADGPSDEGKDLKGYRVRY